MANDDNLQRQIEFIVNNQAQFTSDIQELKELHQRAETRMTKLEDVCLRLGNALVNLAETVNVNSENQSNLESKMSALAESQEHADQRLSALIDIVMADRNGRRPS